jgi:pimeloyl-ACP methyl ester carboxylesterase
LQAPSTGAATSLLPVDAALLVHGTGGNFYSSTMFETVAERLLQLGLAVLTVNTRGHDLASTAVTTAGPRRQGAAYEQVSRCREDLTAWVDDLTRRGYHRVALIGHSLGALKGVYSQAHAPHAAIQRFVAISPPRLTHTDFLAGLKAEEFSALFAKAQAMIAAGRGDDLMDVRFPLPYLVTAAGYVDKYGPDERYSLLPLAERLTGPTLFTFGSQEVQTNAAFQGLPEAIEVLSRQRPNLQVNNVAGADHFYSGCRNELIARIETWLRKPLP